MSDYRKCAINLIANNNDYSSALVSSIFHKLKLSDWSSLSSFSKKKNSIGIEGEAVMPFYTLVMEDNPRNQMLRSVNYSNQNLEKFNNSDVNLKIYSNLNIIMQKVTKIY